MANEQAKQLLQQGIAAARAGQQAQARKLLQEAVKRDPRSESAWLWLSSVAKDDQERAFCLKQLLSINPNNEHALKGLKQLGVGVQQAGTPPAQASAGVPLVDEQKLSASMQQLDPILQQYKPVPTKDLPFEWTKKRRGRVGDSSAAALRATLIGAAIVIVLAIVGGGIFIVSRLGGTGVAAIFSTPTPRPTSTATPTATPGVTDTPSPSPRATLEPSNTPANVTPGDPINAHPTEIYPKVIGVVVPAGLAAAAQGNYKDAIDKLESERNAQANVKGPDYDTIIYFLALTYVDAGNPDRALVVLDEGKSDSPLYHAALGYAEYAKGDYDKALADSSQAFKSDTSLVPAALTIAKIQLLKKNPAAARQALNQALDAQGQAGNTLLLIERGYTYLAESAFDKAESDALLALYADPLNKTAFTLRCQVLLAAAAAVKDTQARIQAYGKAVLAAKDFLLYYYDDTSAWLMLAEGRQGEENYDAALTAYSQAVVVDKSSPDAQRVFMERGKLYLSELRYQDAYDDFDRAIQISDNTEARKGHLQASLGLKNNDAASQDIAVLLKQTANDPDLVLTQVDLLVRSQKPGNITAANALLTDQFVNSLGKDIKPRAQLYQGILLFQAATSNTGATPSAQNPALNTAFDDVTAALTASDSGLGHYYRGQILEALKQPQLAVADYEWIQYWNKVYAYDFASDAANRITAIQNALPTPTPSITLRPSATVPPTKTGTPTKTFTPSKTPTNTPTLKYSLTPTSTDTLTMTETSTDTSTPTEAATAAATETATPTP